MRKLPNSLPDVTEDEYDAELRKRGLDRVGPANAGLVRYNTLDGTGQVYVADTSGLSDAERQELFDLQVQMGRFSEFGF